MTCGVQDVQVYFLNTDHVNPCNEKNELRFNTCDAAATILYCEKYHEKATNVPHRDLHQSGHHYQTSPPIRPNQNLAKVHIAKLVIERTGFGDLRIDLVERLKE